MPDFNPRRYSSGLSKNTVLLAFGSLFADISSEMLYPVIPIFLTQTLRASGSIVGLVEGIAEATQNIAQGASGIISDRLQQRKLVALVGYVLAALSKPLIGLSAVWQGVLGGRFLDRLGSGIRSAPRDALIAASADAKSRGKAFGLEGIGDNAGAFLGPILAVLLLVTFNIELRWIFFLAVIPGLLAVAVVLLVSDRPSPGRTRERLKIKLSQFPPAFWKYLTVIGVFSIGNSSNSFLILQTKQNGASLQGTILIYAVFNLVAALASYPAGYVSDKFGRKGTLIASFVLFFVSYLGFALTGNVAAVAALFALYGVFQGIFRSVGKAFATDLVPESLHATGIGFYSTVVGLMGLVSSLIAGLLWDRIGHAAVFFFGAASALAGLVAAMTLLKAVEQSGRASPKV